MSILLETDPDFSEQFEALLARQHADLDAVAGSVAAIIADIRRERDSALRRFTAQYDRHAPDDFRLDQATIDRAAASCPANVRAALEFAAERIAVYHRAQFPVDIAMTDSLGVRTGARWTPLSSVGIYVPGGSAAYPSSVLMNAIPAKVAGVARIAMAVPTPDGKRNAAVFAAAQIAGVTEAYVVGGAQAIAALAYGTETIRPVDKIVGPGNAYVAAAKRAVFGHVGIDTIAGPSEITVVADRDNDPDWIAADLLSQAEHDEQAQAILITNDRDLADRVAAAIERQLSVLSRESIARVSWSRHGAIVVVSDLARAAALVNRIAPEHVELAVADPERLSKLVHHAGAIFLGRWTPETLGDYVGGPNHVLPTSGAARFSSGLGVLDFMKRTSILECGPANFAALAGPAIDLARAEGLDAHAKAVELRLDALNDGSADER
jgi:histidinol dehydrogenase